MEGDRDKAGRVTALGIEAAVLSAIILAATITALGSLL